MDQGRQSELSPVTEADAQKIQERLKERLAENDGMFPNPKWGCADCRDTGFKPVIEAGVEGVIECPCRTAKRIDRKMLDLPARFRSASIKDTPRSDSQAMAFDRIIKDPTASFFFWGDFEGGKTHVLAIQYRAMVGRGIPCYFRTGDELVLELQRAATATKENPYESEILSALSSATPGGFHLFWDDCDKVDWDRTPFRREAIGEVVDRIYRGSLGLTVTANYDLGEISKQEKIPQYVVSRIDRICRENIVKI